MLELRSNALVLTLLIFFGVPSAILATGPESTEVLSPESHAEEVESVEETAAEDDGDSEVLEEESEALEEEAETQSPPPPPPAAPRPAGPLSKLEVHGFLTQAWATTDFVGGRFPGPGGVDPGPTFDELALGISEDGTFDYRTMALQFRYQISPKDIMVVQLSSRSLGDSLINDVEEEIELDWAFYERRLTDNTSLKVGRVQIPLGIFNEFRDVGTILPFYRPSFVFYREGTFTSETVDGVLLSHVFNPESDWSIEADVYVGEWDYFEFSPFDSALTIAENEGYGAQIWLNTPIPGLRFGAGGHIRETSGGAEGVTRAPGTKNDFDDIYFSIEAALSRFVFRAEYREFTGDPAPSPLFLGQDLRATFPFYYAQVGYHFNDKFRVYLQHEVEDGKNSSPALTRDFDVVFREDTGIAFNYIFNPNLVLKAEYHEVGGEDLTFLPIFGPEGPPVPRALDPLIKDLEDGNYAIVSLSVSF